MDDNGSLPSEIVDRVDDGIVVTDENMKIVFVNHAIEKLFGYHRSELVGQNVKMLVPVDRRPAHEAAAVAYISSPDPQEIHARPGLTGLTKDGDEIPVDIKIAPLDNELFVATVRQWKPKTPRLELPGFINRISFSFVASLTLALLSGLFALSLSHPVPTFWALNVFLISTALALVIAYSNAVVDAIRERRRGMTAGHLLTFGIVLSGAGLAARQVGWWWTGDAPDLDALSFWIVSLGLSLIGGFYHIAAVDAVEARYAPRYFVMSAIFVLIIGGLFLWAGVPTH
jgi:PAS domain S-box-containing protein